LPARKAGIKSFEMRCRERTSIELHGEQALAKGAGPGSPFHKGLSPRTAATRKGSLVKAVQGGQRVCLHRRCCGRSPIRGKEGRGLPPLPEPALRVVQSTFAL